MRENRTYGSEGGEARAFPTPIGYRHRLNARHPRVSGDPCAREGALSARWKSARQFAMNCEVEGNCVTVR